MSPAVQPWRGLAEAPPKRRFATLPPQALAYCIRHSTEALLDEAALRARIEGMI